jgi:hypothetical protein
MTQTGNDGAFDPTPQVVDSLGDLFAALSALGLQVNADTPPGGIGTHRVPRVTLDDLGPELEAEVIATITTLGEDMPDPVDLADLGEAQVGVQVAVDGTVERFPFPADDLEGLAERVQARLSGPYVTGSKAVELADNLIMWTLGYDADPTPEFLAGQTPNVGATFLTWMVHGGVLPVFGPVLFTGGGPTDGGSFDGLDGLGVAVVEEIVGSVRPGAAERFGPRLRELAGQGAYLQGAPA